MITAFQLPQICGNWSLHAGHKKAQMLVNEIGEIMHLNPAGRDSRKIYLYLRKHNNSIHLPENVQKKSLSFTLPQLEPDAEKYCAYIHLSSLFSLLAIDNGAILLHAALAEKNGHGALFMGPGDVGKTTISKRLPAPWRAMCDDTTLVYAQDGQIYAHPWPTWSCFTMDCPGGSWDVSQRVPLHALFMLKQSHQDEVTPLDKQKSLHALTQSILQIGHTTFRRMSQEKKNNFIETHIQIAKQINASLDSFILENTLTGQFWKKIDTVWHPDEPSRKKILEEHIHMQDHAIYTGPSMFPVFHDPEYVKIGRYEKYDEIKKGDVIYFKSPNEEKNIIHRVIQKKNEKLRTRGDNNPYSDPYWVTFNDIYGRITHSTFQGMTRQIAGGFQGMLLYRKHIIRRLFLLKLQTIKQKHNRVWNDLVSVGKFLIRKKDLHIIEFKQPRYPVYKLFFNGKWIGQYNPIRHRWKLEGIFRFLVDKTKLPDPEQQLY